MKELLRQAFQLGQQWTHDVNNDKDPIDFNTWYDSDEIQQKIKMSNKDDVKFSTCCGAEMVSFKTYGYDECCECGKTYRIKGDQ